MVEWLAKALNAFPAESALYWVDLKTGMPIAAIRETEKVVSASTIKLPVLCCALQEVLEGRLTLDQFLPLEAGDRCDDTAVFEPEYRTDGASLKEMLYWMIVESDNTATNAVLSLLGFSKINSYCASLGLMQTSVQRKMLDFAAVEAGRNNHTSLQDQYRLYKLLFDGGILNGALRAVAFDFLSRVRHMDGLQRYITDDVTVLHKPGGLDHLNHDAGIFLLEDRPYFLGVFTWDGPALDGEPQQNRLIGKVSRAIYDYTTRGDHTMKAIVNKTTCALLAQPSRESTLVDEVLYGMTVDILEEAAPGWYKVRTHYRYEGIAAGEDLLMDPEAVARWEALPKKTVYHKNTCDVLAEPKVQGYFMQSVTRGGLVASVGEPEKGWQKVILADGREGYMPAAILGEHHTVPCAQKEPQLRQALVDAALLYQGTHYRWGGKSPLGIDCSGLVSMAYMLCGILIYRDADIREGFPIHEIPLENVRTGDLLFFPGHVAMYMGNGRYCHSTGKDGDNGFAINSLNPRHPDFRADLKEQITRVGSYF